MFVVGHCTSRRDNRDLTVPLTEEEWDSQEVQDTGLCDTLLYWSYNIQRKEPTLVLAVMEKIQAVEQDSRWNTHTQNEDNHRDPEQ